MGPIKARDSLGQSTFLSESCPKMRGGDKLLRQITPNNIKLPTYCKSSTDLSELYGDPRVSSLRFATFHCDIGL